LEQSTATRSDDTLPMFGHESSRTSYVPPRPLDLAARTDIGKHRRRNEDQYVIAHLGRWIGIHATSVGVPREMASPQGTLLVVADGMGGHGAGDVASAVTLDSFVEHLLVGMPWLISASPAGDALLTDDVERFLVACQDRLHEVAKRRGLPSDLGTTLTVAYVTGARLILAHVGDSRAYLQRGRILRCLTHDHTLGAGLGGSESGPFAHVLVNAIGGNVDRPQPELSAMELLPGDRVLLCSDGLHGMLNDAQIAELLASATTARAAVDSLVDAALAEGGRDNVTAVAAFG